MFKHKVDTRLQPSSLPTVELHESLSRRTIDPHFENDDLLAQQTHDDSRLPLLAQSFPLQAGDTSENPTSSFSLFLESGITNLGKCHGWCTSICSSLCCRFRSENFGTPDQPSEQLLSSSFDDDFDVLGGSTGCTYRPPDCEVEGWMRRRLIYFFMSPFTKYKAKKRPPFKLIIAILKLIFVTLQIVEFGVSRASHVSFEQDSAIAFCHLYLRDWGAQYETLAYPPAVGAYSVYRRDEMYRTLSFAIQQYNMTEDTSIGAYIFQTERRTLQLCTSGLLTKEDDQPQSLTRCSDLHMFDLSPDEIDGPDRMEAFLASNNLLFTPSELSGIDLHFNLLTPVISELTWAKGPECFSFAVHISMNKHLRAGMMRIQLFSTAQSVHCSDLVSPATAAATVHHKAKVDVDSVRRLWAELQSTGQVKGRLPLRRILVILLDALLICLSTVSFILCTRSVVRSFYLWKETVVFFRVWFSFTLTGAVRDFLNLWLFCIMLNDFLICSSSLIRLVIIHQVEGLLESIAYIFGVSAILIWSDALRFIASSNANSLLIRTIVRSIPSLVRFSICSLILFFAFSLCGWLVLGPYHIKFCQFGSSMECLFSLLNGDDMYVTFSVIGDRAPIGVYIFSRIFLYLFISLFTYVVLNLLITIIFEAYEEVKNNEDSHGRPKHLALKRFMHQETYPLDSPLFRDDDRRPDRHSLHLCSQGLWPVSELVFRCQQYEHQQTASPSQTSADRPSSPHHSTVIHVETVQQVPTDDDINSSSMFTSTSKTTSFRQQRQDQPTSPSSPSSSSVSVLIGSGSAGSRDRGGGGDGEGGDGDGETTAAGAKAGRPDSAAAGASPIGGFTARPT